MRKRNGLKFVRNIVETLVAISILFFTTLGSVVEYGPTLVLLPLILAALGIQTYLDAERLGMRQLSKWLDWAFLWGFGSFLAFIFVFPVYFFYARRKFGGEHSFFWAMPDKGSKKKFAVLFFVSVLVIVIASGFGIWAKKYMLF